MFGLGGRLKERNAALSGNREEFQYEPLLDNSIRILSLAPGTWSDTIECELVSIALDEQEELYEALSYTWGTHTKTRQISCNGKTLNVTENSFDALRQLRRKDSVYRLWIDQVCIDQKNIDEKNVQVPLMGKIYSQAAKVVVWLGPPDADSAIAIRYARRILNVPDAVWETLPTDVTGLLAALNFPDSYDPSWLKFASLFLRPWFSRAWIIQEVAFAKSICVVLGLESFSWDQWTVLRCRIGTAVYFILDNQAPAQILSSNGLTVVEVINEFRKNLLQGHPVPANKLWTAATIARASDPRDLVFAFTNLGHWNIKIDYNRPYEEIFKEFFLHYMCGFSPNETGTEIRTVNIETVKYCLPLCEETDRPASLPGWIPDWSKGRRRRPIGCHRGKPCFQAGGKEDGLVILTNGITLLLPGKVYDTVWKAGTSWLDIDDISNSVETIRVLKAWFNENARLQTQLPLTYPNGRPRDEAYKRTLFVNHTPAECFPSAASIQPWYNNVTYYCGLTTIDALLQVMTKNQIPMFVQMTKHLRRRLFFITEKGYMGIGPLGTKPGSRVCVFQDFQTPFITNEDQSQGFRLLGDSYIFGMMLGEAMQDPTVPLQTIELI